MKLRFAICVALCCLSMQMLREGCAIEPAQKVLQQEAIDIIVAHYYWPVQRKQLEVATGSQLAGQLDSYSRWIPPQEARTLRSAMRGVNAVKRKPTVLGLTKSDVGAWDYWCSSEQQIGYLRVTAFGTDTAREFRAAVRK